MIAAASTNTDGVALSIVVVLFLAVTVLGFAAARWRRAESLANLDEWGLGGRGFGTFVTWFLLGGDLYTAYTFIAVPALMFAAGALGFFAVPYTIIVYPVVCFFPVLAPPSAPPPVFLFPPGVGVGSPPPVLCCPRRLRPRPLRLAWPR